MLFNQVKLLLERGHHVQAWTTNAADHSYLPLSDLTTERVVPLQPRVPPGLYRLSSALGDYWHTRARVAALHRACARAARDIHEARFDVVFANTCKLFAMPFIVRHVQLPTVTYLQEPVRALYETGGSYPRALPWVGRLEDESAPWREVRWAPSDPLQIRTLRLRAREEWLSARATGGLLVNSYYSREVILRTYGRDADVCYLGIDTDTFRDLRREREHMVVGLGSFDRIKGIGLAIEAVAKVPHPRPRMVWVANSGSESYIDEMRTLARKREVDLEIRMRVSDDELVETLNRAALMLYTSRLEPFGLSPLEANACGTPVVAVREAGVRETIHDGLNGFLAGRSPDSIAEAITRLLRDPALARKMGEAAARHVAEQWTWRNSVDCLERELIAAVSG